VIDSRTAISDPYLESPQRFLDASWLESMPYYEMVNTLLKDDPTSPFIAGYIIESLGLSVVDADLDQDILALFTIGAQDFQNFLAVVGGVCGHEKIRQTLRREEVMAIKADLGKAGYEFILNVGWLLRPPPQFTDSEFFMDGLKCLRIGLLSQHQAIGERLTLKCPRSIVEKIEIPTELDAARYWRFIMKVFKEYRRWLRSQR